MLRNVLHKISIASMLIGGVLICGSMESVNIDMLTFAEMFKYYWSVGIPMVIGGGICFTLVKTIEF